MLERYTLPFMQVAWAPENQYVIWRQVQIASAIAQGAPDSILEELNSAFTPTVEQVHNEELNTRHDVAAFINVWRRAMSEDAARWVHRGMTSSDLVDSGNAVRAGILFRYIDDAAGQLIHAAAQHAVDHWNTPRLARTHGQPAEVSTWGYWVANFVAALRRAVSHHAVAVNGARTGKLSGPVGNYRYISPEQEEHFCHILDIIPARVATQTVARDGIADWVFSLARIASVIEWFATEVRLGQQFGIDELAEGFAPGQVGSSSMPHKRNPISAEQLCGLARIVRGQVTPLLEGVATWHERDISHSSAERVAVQTATTLTHYMLVTAKQLIDGLQVRAPLMDARIVEAGSLTESAWLQTYGVVTGQCPPDLERSRAYALAPISRTQTEMNQPEPRVDHVLTWLHQTLQTY